MKWKFIHSITKGSSLSLFDFPSIKNQNLLTSQRFSILKRRDHLIVNYGLKSVKITQTNLVVHFYPGAQWQMSLPLEEKFWFCWNPSTKPRRHFSSRYIVGWLCSLPFFTVQFKLQFMKVFCRTKNPITRGKSSFNLIWIMDKFYMRSVLHRIS